MSGKTEMKAVLKNEKAKLYEEISSTKKIMSDYKADRRVDWKEFKSKMNDNIDKIEKSVDALASRKKK
jgi:hypothetical protein